MLRSISYRSAATMFVFAGLWFAVGLFLLWTPVPGALGIGRQLFAAWLVLFLLALAAAGGALVLAAVNGIFPPRVRAPARNERIWAPPGPEQPSAALPRRPGRPDTRRRPGARTRGG